MIRSNIVLIGMPGCGKTTVGRCLAERLKLTFADTDELVLKLTGRSPEKLIMTDGESVFREAEHRAALLAAGMSDTVIATGGGIVMRPDNMTVLRQNGIVIYLERPLDSLDITGRPLSAAGSESLFAQREQLYLKYCDLRVQNTAPDTEAAAAVAAELLKKSKYI